MDFEKFRIEDGHLVIHQDHLEEGVKEFESEARDCLLDALWMGCDMTLSVEGSFIRVSVVVYALPESEEEAYNTDDFPLLDFVADVNGVDAWGNIRFTVLLVQSIPVKGGGTVEEVLCKDFQLSLNR